MIMYYALRNALYRDSAQMELEDLLLAIKQFKYGYPNFDVPEVVLSVYNKVFENVDWKIVYIIEITRQWYE